VAVKVGAGRLGCGGRGRCSFYRRTVRRYTKLARRLKHIRARREVLLRQRQERLTVEGRLQSGVRPIGDDQLELSDTQPENEKPETVLEAEEDAPPEVSQGMRNPTGVEISFGQPDVYTEIATEAHIEPVSRPTQSALERSKEDEMPEDEARLEPIPEPPLNRSGLKRTMSVEEGLATEQRRGSPDPPAKRAKRFFDVCTIM
jgi:hypothetical protein